MRLFYKRLAPVRINEMRDDTIVHADDDIIITKWHTPRPKAEFTHGASCYFINEGYKVSKFYGEGNEFKFYYCDIITVHTEDNDDIICTDLLLDVIVEKDGRSRILDIDEAIEAHKTGQITTCELTGALDSLDRLLKIIYSGNFSNLTQYVDGVW